jgi:predicted nucleotidyltransferase
MTPERVAILRTWAASQPLVGMLYVFGSRTRGTARPDSDLDVAIELDPAAICGCDDSASQLTTWMSNTTSWKEHLSAALGVPADLQQHSGPEHTPRIHGLLAEAVLLYWKPGFTSAYPASTENPPA